MTRNELIQLVMTKMDELTPYDEGLVLTPDASQKPIEQTIDSLLDECLRDILLIHPVHRLTAVSASPTPYVAADSSGYFALPANFLRLVSLLMAGWKQNVTELLTRNSPESKLQSMKYVKGGITHPFAIRTTEIIDLQPKDAIHYWSLPQGVQHRIEHFLYIKNMVAEEADKDLIDGLSWLTASKCLSAMGHIAEAGKAIEYFNAFNQRP